MAIQYWIGLGLFALLAGLFINDRSHDDHGSGYTPAPIEQCVPG